MEQRTATIPFDLETAKKININDNISKNKR